MCKISAISEADTDQYYHCYDNSIMIVITWTIIDGLDSFNVPQDLPFWAGSGEDKETEAPAEQTHGIHNRTVE
jgi:hypothetical protein